ncbi:MAG: hypothetical protein J5949_09820 [Oscillospiraceae bacterium]|nr:hypothetical protein [Oscillospiraceae bacterium]
MSVFVLKILAMSSMVSDHIAYAFVDPNQLLMRKIIGRLAFILYAFLMSESYYHLRGKPGKLRQHVIKLLILGVGSEFLYDMFDYGRWVDFSTQNVIWTLLLGFSMLIAAGYIREHVQNRPVRAVSIAAVCFAAAGTAYCIKCNYGFAGVMLIGMFYLYLCRADAADRLHKLGCLALIEAVFCFLFVWESVGFGGWNALTEKAWNLRQWGVGIAVALIPLVFYNREIGYKSKWFNLFYSLFYPLQFAVILIVRAVL